jgi:hypothetical protein
MLTPLKRLDRLPRSSRYPDPYEAETPVSLRPFIDWFSSASPEEFAEDERASDAAKVLDSVSGLVGIKARYEKYRKFMIAKQVRNCFSLLGPSPQLTCTPSF